MKRREMEALSAEECRRFLAVARESSWFGLFALALTTGMRPSEYLALKWNDIDWQRGTASVCRTIQRSGSGWTFEDTKRKRKPPPRKAAVLCAGGFGEHTKFAETTGGR